MNIRSFSRTLIYSTAALLSLWLAAACSDSNGGDPYDPGFKEGIPTEVSFSLSARSAGLTRSDGTPKDPDAAVEFIHDWWMAFVDRNNDVRILRRNNATDRNSSITGGSTNTGGGFEVETFKTVIPSGTYDIYAFANIPVKSAAAIKTLLAEGKDLESILDSDKFADDNTQWPKNQNIPMTGFIKGARIRNTIEEIFSIEVIRAVAKVRFSIKNPTDDYIKLKNLTMEPMTTGKVSLFPDYTAIGDHAFTPLEDVEYAPLSLDAYLNPAELTKDTPCDFFFYCKESLGKLYERETEESFKITLTVDRRRAGTTDTETDLPREFFTKNIRNYINRNDWIYIPIEFNDWKIFWKLHFYPPIGGYPPVFNQNDDGTSLSATLTTGGEFELYPYKIEKNGNEYKEKIDWSKVKAEVLSGDNLFITKPDKIDNPGNLSPHPVSTDYIIAGELDPKIEGQAKVKISFELIDSQYSGTIFTCTFTINRQNGN